MVTPLNKLAKYWRDDANNPNLSLTPPQRDAMRECADELQQSFAQFRESKRLFANKGDSKANFIADGDLSCPHCGSSWHAGDMKQTANAFTAGDMADAGSRGYDMGYEQAAKEREALIVGMLAMLQDLYDGYGWDNLAMDMGEVHDRVDGFGIEHEVTRG